jgi:uncharacterized protein YndB with AHSA1/START domain
MPSAEREIHIERAVGAVYRQVVKGPMGRQIDADIETTELVPNELIAFRTRTGPRDPVDPIDRNE